MRSEFSISNFIFSGNFEMLLSVLRTVSFVNLANTEYQKVLYINDDMNQLNYGSQYWDPEGSIYCCLQHYIFTENTAKSNLHSDSTVISLT